MTHRMRIIHFTIGTLLAAGAVSALAHHEGDLVVGVSGAGQLRAEFDFAEPIALPAVNGLLVGWASSEPGFDHLEVNEPTEDFYVLGEGVQVRFDVVSFAEAFKAWTPGFGAALHDPGDAYVFPDGNLLHGHLHWHIDSQDPLFSPGAGPWTASFRLVDIGTTGYSPSDVYTLTFTPEPASAALLGLSALAAARRLRVRGVARP